MHTWIVQRFLIGLALAASLAAAWPARAALLVEPTGTVLFSDATGADDDVTTRRALGFELNFFDTPYTEVDVCTNGHLNFLGDDDFDDEPLPGLIPRICALWDDLEVRQGSGDSIVERVVPGVYYAVTWTVHGQSDPTTRHVFQVVIFGSQTRIGKIDYQPSDIVISYDQIGPNFHKQSATVGLGEGEDGRLLTLPALTATNGRAQSSFGPSLLALPGGRLHFRVSEEEESGYALPELIDVAPSAQDDVGFAFNLNNRVVVLPLENDSDPEGDPVDLLSVTAGALGTTSINLDGSISYQPGSQFSGTDQFTYTVGDGRGQTATATVLIMPLASAQGNYGGPWGDEDNGELGRVKIAVDTEGEFSGSLTPDGGEKVPFTGSFDSSGRYSGDVEDADGGVYAVTLVLDFRNGAHRIVGTVDEVPLIAARLANSAPTPRDDLAYSVGRKPVTIRVLANDTDPDGDLLTVVGVKQGVTGSVSFTPEGLVTYTPLPGFGGSDRFTYRVLDPDGEEGTAEVSVVGYSVARGRFVGLVQQFDEDGLPVAETDGQLVVDLTGSGKFSASLIFAGVKSTLVGKFGPDGIFEKVLLLPDGTSVMLTLRLDYSQDSNQITGSLSDGETVSSIAAGRSRYQAASLPAPLAGNWNVLLPPDEVGGVGYGFVRLRITKGGAVAAAGRLGDGRACAFASVLQLDGTVPVFVVQKTKGTASLGSLAGQLSFTGETCAGSLYWFQPPSDDGETFFGLSGPVAASGGRYRAPAPGERLLGATATVTNATLSIEGEPMEATIDAVNRVSVVASEGSKVTLKVDPATGLFLGRHIFLGDEFSPRLVRPFSGLIVPTEARGGGFIRGEDGMSEVLLEKVEPEEF